jgi:hypothetical protein
MIFTYVVASAKAPIEGQAQVFLDCFREPTEPANCIAMIIREGPGCVNYGFMIDAPSEEDADRYMNQVTMALMPSKWSNAMPDPDLIEGTFADLRQVTV